MIINNNLYESYNNIGVLRKVLLENFYTNPNCIQRLAIIIGETIECISLEYKNYIFFLKIKKTSIKKRIKGFNNNSSSYYQDIISIFYKFINENRAAIYSALKKEGCEDLLTQIDNNNNILASVCNVLCMNDNVVHIKL